MHRAFQTASGRVPSRGAHSITPLSRSSRTDPTTIDSKPPSPDSRSGPRGGGASPFGRRARHWKCDRGFKRVADRCDQIQVSEHAFPEYPGKRWQCERGYKRVNDQCQVVQVPEHAFLNTWGDGGECEWGFRRSGDRCAPE